MKRSDVERITREITEPIVEELSFELVDIEYIKEGPHMYLRIYIDKPGGVSLDDCQQLSEKVSKSLDEIDPIEENYFLEVSSPGLDRPLKNDKDFNRSLGKEVELNFYKAVDGNKKITGKLLDFDEDNFYIEDEKLGKLAVDRSIVSKINLAIIF